MATGLDNLWVYKLVEELEIDVHKLTKAFPRDEFYRSVDQLRRSSSSIANNLAESYHKTTSKEKVRFIDIALGEAEETKRNLIKSIRKEFIEEKLGNPLVDRHTLLMKGLFAFRKFLELQKPKLLTKN